MADGYLIRIEDPRGDNGPVVEMWLARIPDQAKALAAVAEASGGENATIKDSVPDNRLIALGLSEGQVKVE